MWESRLLFAVVEHDTALLAARLWRRVKFVALLAEREGNAADLRECEVVHGEDVYRMGWDEASDDEESATVGAMITLRKSAVAEACE